MTLPVLGGLLLLFVACTVLAHWLLSELDAVGLELLGAQTELATARQRVRELEAEKPTGDQISPAAPNTPMEVPGNPDTPGSEADRPSPSKPGRRSSATRDSQR